MVERLNEIVVAGLKGFLNVMRIQTAVMSVK